MKKTVSKSQAKNKIDNFFKNIESKTPKEIKKIKKLSMAYKIPLKGKRKLFCKYCLNTYKNPKIRIKNKIKIITCENCGKIARWKIK